MADRMIKNISNLQHALPVHVKGAVMGKDVVVQLNVGEVFWCPDDRDTKSLLVYTKKRFLEMAATPKPVGANYFEAYPATYWDSTGVESVQPAEAPAPESLFHLDFIDNRKKEPEPEVAQGTKWEEAEVTYLRRNYPKHGLLHCVEKLGRNKKSVKKKIEALGLKKEYADDKE